MWDYTYLKYYLPGKLVIKTLFKQQLRHPAVQDSFRTLLSLYTIFKYISQWYKKLLLLFLLYCLPHPVSLGHPVLICKHTNPCLTGFLDLERPLLCRHRELQAVRVPRPATYWLSQNHHQNHHCLQDHCCSVN